MSTQVEQRLWSDVAALIGNFEDRRVGSPGHLAARQWVQRRLSDLRLSPFRDGSYVLPYESRFANVVGVVPAAPGSDPHAKPWVLGAHYDTVPFTPGADDNAASVAVVLEVAARLMARPVNRPVVVPIFDAEEPPYFRTEQMGSRRLVEDHLGDHVHAAVILDLVAHQVQAPGLGDLVGFMGAESHPAWAETVRAVAQEFGPLLSLPNAVMPDMSDHYAFRLQGLPFIFVSCGQGPHYHMPTDTIENMDLPKAARVADMVERLIRGADASPFDGAVTHDASLLSYDLLRDLLGTEALTQLGVGSSQDVDRGLRHLVGLLR